MGTNKKWLDSLPDDELYKLFTCGLKTKRVDTPSSLSTIVCLTFSDIKDQCIQNNIRLDDWLKEPQEYCLYNE